MREIDLKNMKSKLDKIGPGMCLAKWLQVTMHLHLGHNHSCHHPLTHKINKSEIKKNPSALHNTKFKQAARLEMLNGDRPSECNYCWQVEDSGESTYSDRVIKSSAGWANSSFDKVVDSKAGENIKPKYLEVSFSHACNFKCSYCAPHFSSSWEKEIQKDGPYMLDRVYNGIGINAFMSKRPLDVNKPNPYVDAFWQWFPEIYNDLSVLRVTGGEPLLSGDTFKLFDKIKNTPNPNMKLAINTNLGVPDTTIDKTIDVLKSFKTGYHVKKLEFYTSVDTWGQQAEYIRHGLNFEKFWINLKKVLLELPNVDVNIMCTFNNLSVPNFKVFLQNFLKLKREVAPHRPDAHFLLDIPYLKNPLHQSFLLLPRDYTEIKITECIEFMENNKDLESHWFSPDFIEIEVGKMQRLLEILNNEPVDKLANKYQKANFYKFFAEHDKRRGTDFLKTFPELKKFWNSCKKSANATAFYPDMNLAHTVAWGLSKATNFLKLK